MPIAENVDKQYIFKSLKLCVNNSMITIKSKLLKCHEIKYYIPTVEWKWKSLGRVQLFMCTVHGILQARILDRVAFPSSRASSQPKDRTQISCLAGGFFISSATGKATRAIVECHATIKKNFLSRQN